MTTLNSDDYMMEISFQGDEHTAYSSSISAAAECYFSDDDSIEDEEEMSELEYDFSSDKANFSSESNCSSDSEYTFHEEKDCDDIRDSHDGKGEGFALRSRSYAMWTINLPAGFEEEEEDDDTEGENFSDDEDENYDDCNGKDELKFKKLTPQPPRNPRISFFENVEVFKYDRCEPASMIRFRLLLPDFYEGILKFPLLVNSGDSSTMTKLPTIVEVEAECESVPDPKLENEMVDVDSEIVDDDDDMDMSPSPTIIPYQEGLWCTVHSLHFETPCKLTGKLMVLMVDPEYAVNLTYQICLDPLDNSCMKSNPLVVTAVMSNNDGLYDNYIIDHERYRLLDFSFDLESLVTSKMMMMTTSTKAMMIDQMTFDFAMTSICYLTCNPTINYIDYPTEGRLLLHPVGGGSRNKLITPLKQGEGEEDSYSYNNNNNYDKSVRRSLERVISNCNYALSDYIFQL